jgi:hypothetical protein
MQTLTKVLPATAPTREPLVGSERGGNATVAWAQARQADSKVMGENPVIGLVR